MLDLLTPTLNLLQPIGNSSPACVLHGLNAHRLAPPNRETKQLTTTEPLDELAPILKELKFAAHQFIIDLVGASDPQTDPIVRFAKEQGNDYTKLLILTDNPDFALPWLTFARQPVAPDTVGYPLPTYALYCSLTHRGPLGSANSDRGARLPGTWAYQKHPFQDSERRWRAAHKEFQSRRLTKATGQERIHLDLTEAGLIDNRLTEFDRLNESIDPSHILLAEALAHHSPYDLVLHRQHRNQLHFILHKDATSSCRCPWRISAKLRSTIEDALLNAVRSRASIYPLPATQRLGYIDEVDTIRCLKSIPPFVAGVHYPVQVKSVQVSRERQRPNLSGVMETVEYTANESMIVVAGPEKNHRFVDSRVITRDTRFPYVPNLSDTAFSLQQLVDHFEIPEVSDIASIHPAPFASNGAALAQIESALLAPRKIRLKDFQREDLARAACLPGLIIAWDTGLGKTWAMFLFPLLKVGYNLVWQPLSATPPKPGDEPALIEAKGIAPNGVVLIVAPGDLHDQIANEAWNRFGITVHELPNQAAFHILVRGYTPDARPILPKGFYLTTYTALALNGTKVPADIPEQFHPSEGPSGNNGMQRHVACVFNPSLAHLAAHAFDCVVIDEGVRIKSSETHIGKAIAILQPRYRAILTATPIKNRLLDIFRLLWWATGGQPAAHPRFPYGPGESERKRLGDAHLVVETTLGPRPRKKITAEVCNVQSLYKLIAPSILRRRKSDIAEQLPPKIRQVIYVPMGIAQHRVYQCHLHGRYTDSRDQPAIIAKLQALRIAASAPHSALLQPVHTESMYKAHRSSCPYIPKIHAALQLILKALQKGEQFVAFSFFADPLDNIAHWLNEAGVPNAILDGRLSPSKRAALSARFQSGPIGRLPVLGAGMESCAEGHNWWWCNNAALLSYTWAADKLEQCINRIHRLPSPEAVNIFPILAQGSVDLQLEDLREEKSRTSDLVLDGKLLGEATEEITLWELLRSVERDATRAGDSLADELHLQTLWPELRDKLTAAAIQWPRVAEQRAQRLASKSK